MATIQTLTSTRQNKMPLIANEGKPSMSFVCDTVLDRGAVVKLLSTGKVAPIALLNDVVFGVVTVAYADVTQPVTVHLAGSSVIKARASATIAIGDTVDATSWHTGTKLTVVTATASTGNQVGIAITGGAATAEIMVLLTKI